MYSKGFKSLAGVRGLLANAPEGRPAYTRIGYLSALEQASHVYGSPGSHQAPIE